VEANSRYPELEKLRKGNMELNLYLSTHEALADIELNKEDSKEVLSDINSLKSLTLDEFKNILERNDPIDDDPTAKFLRLLASFDSLEYFEPNMAKTLISSLGPVSEDALSEINSQCNGIYDLSPSERATKLAGIKAALAPYILTQDDVTFFYQKLHSPEWCLAMMGIRDKIFLGRLATWLTNKYKRLYKGQHLLQKSAAITKVIAACSMKFLINLVRDKYLAKAARMKWTRDLFEIGYQIGYHDGAMEVADLALIERAQYIHSTLSGMVIF